MSARVRLSTSSTRSALTGTVGELVHLLVITLEGHPSSRLRIGQYIPALRSEGVDVEIFEVPSPRIPVSTLARIGGAVRESDAVFVQRIAYAPLNALLRASGVRVIYDVDDAIHLIRPVQLEATRSPRSIRERLTVRHRELIRGSRYFGSRKRPFDQIAGFADVVIVGNKYLRSFTTGSRSEPIVLPTCVAAADEPKKHGGASPIRIGWIGTRNNLADLDALEPAFRALSERFGGEVLLSVVSSRPYVTSAIAVESVRWSLETERESVRRFDVGIMPLADDLFARGKCSFKAIQCMAEGIPVVVSSVGMNVEVVRDGVNGYLAGDSQGWIEYLTALIQDPDLRQRLGLEALATVRRSYSYGMGLRTLRRLIAPPELAQGGAALGT
jgi:glycosyltransferase involved in cell wall biosynthesis